MLLVRVQLAPGRDGVGERAQVGVVECENVGDVGLAQPSEPFPLHSGEHVPPSR